MVQKNTNGSTALVSESLITDQVNNSVLKLPIKVPKQRYRPTQSNIPDDKKARIALKKTVDKYVQKLKAVPPLDVEELRGHAKEILKLSNLDNKFEDYTAILVNNESWKDTLAKIPFDRRLLLLPKCLRIEEHCPAPFDEFGLLCKECGLCSIQDLSVEAERLGYAVLVAEGSAIVRQMIETGKIEAVVGVSCINVLEKSFPHMEAAAIPGMAIPLLQDDCVNTTVDLDWVWDLIHLTSEDKTYRLDLDLLKKDVKSWFSKESLIEIMGEAIDDTSRIAQEWLARDGKRWRPYITACTFMALQVDQNEMAFNTSSQLKKLAVAVECFHKASLIHDDIEDGDQKRYGTEALYVQVGLPIALNVGDYLLGEGYRLIADLECDSETKVKILRCAAEGHLTLSRGQGQELSWNREPETLTSLEVLDIFRKKTAPAFEVALRFGAYLGGASEEIHEILGKYSESLGIAYQIRDDLEDFDGERDSNDLEDLRPSLVLAIAYKRTPEGDEKELISSLYNGEISYQEVSKDIKKILYDQDIIQKAEELLEAYKEDAIRNLRFLSNPTLKGLLRRVVGKIFGEHFIEGYCSEFEARNAASSSVGTKAAVRSD
ncbi:MAG: polyprenyl synthetase family protein [Acidobacteriia bacterium]|nr:polyprenyl synthetase family protein [Terriglobia bacterium]